MDIDRSLACFSLAWHRDPAVLEQVVQQRLGEGRISLVGPQIPLGREFDLVIQSAVGDMARDITRYIFPDSPAIVLPDVRLSGSLVLSCNMVTGFVMETLAIDLADRGDVDLLISLIHSHGGVSWETPTKGSAEVAGIGRSSIAHLLVSRMSEFFDCSEEALGRHYGYRILELRGPDCMLDRIESDALQSEVHRATYGLLTGDEGWRHVPSSRARTVVSNFWSSREFLQVTAHGRAVVAFNTKTADYAERQQGFFLERFGSAREYFGTEFDVAGLDHGVFFACENALERIVLADTLVTDIRAEQAKRETVKTRSLFPRSHVVWRELVTSNLQSAHIRVRGYLDSLRDSDVEEVNDMLHLITEKSGVLRYENRIREYADMMDSELDRVWDFQLTRVAVLVSIVSLLCTATSLFIVLKVL